MDSKILIRDSYIGGIGNASFIPDNPGYHPNQLLASEEEPSSEHDVIKQQPISAAWNEFKLNKSGNQTDEDKIIQLTCSDDVKVTNINKTEEYNVGYVGLSILPWEEFVFNPRVFNELFYVESNNRITYDPDEVNTFFHGKNVMPPSVGDISENGKSWNIVVDNISDLKKVRTWLTERCSIFGVTLLYKEKRFGKPERAPCLVMMDPNKGNIGDKLYTTITRAMDSLHNRRRFCVEVNINGCVERWCKRVLMTDCKVVGGKLVITNGEEYLAMDDVEDKICCVVCFPIWLLQTGIYKLHRKVVYDDFKVTFDVDDLFLHGAFQDVRCQRRHIFTVTQNQDQSVFRTRSAGQTDMKTLQDLGSFKFVCVKKYHRSDLNEQFDENCMDRVTEHNTTTFGDLVEKRKEKVMIKEERLKAKEKSKREKYDNSNEKYDISNEAKIDSTETSRSQDITYQTETTTSEPVEKDSESEDVSESDDNEPSFHIPVVASVLCDNDEDSYQDIPDTERAGSSLFSPGAHHDLVPKDEFDNVRKSFGTDLTGADPNSNNVMQFEMNNIDPDSDSDSESIFESSKDSALNTKTEKDELLIEMLKIEKTLPSIRKESLYGAKDLKELTAKEGINSLQKKKTKERPGVKRAIKDLMKTTKGKQEPLPSMNDERFKEASIKIKQEKHVRSEKSTDELSSNKENSLQKDSENLAGKKVDKDGDKREDTMTHASKKESETSDSHTGGKSLIQAYTNIDQDDPVIADDVVDFVVNQKEESEKYAAVNKEDKTTLADKRSSPEGGNDDKVTNMSDLLGPDDSSTDGDEVEMIYQAPPNHNDKRKHASLFLHQDEDDFGFIEKVNKKSFIDFNVEDKMEDIPFAALGNSLNKTDGEKLNQGSTPTRQSDSPHRNDMFQKTNKASARTKQRTKKAADEHPVQPIMTKSLDIDMEVTDLDEDIEQPSQNIVKSVDTGITAKAGSGQGVSKKSKRGLRQTSSTRKYLGTSVPPKQYKGK